MKNVVQVLCLLAASNLFAGALTYHNVSGSDIHVEDSNGVRVLENHMVSVSRGFYVEVGKLTMIDKEGEKHQCTIKNLSNEDITHQRHYVETRSYLNIYTVNNTCFATLIDDPNAYAHG